MIKPLIKDLSKRQNNLFAPYYKIITAILCFCLAVGCVFSCAWTFLFKASGFDKLRGNTVLCKAATVNPLYARIITDDTPFFADSEGVEQAFTLPYTYYVKVLEKGELLSHVEFGAEGSAVIDGYVPTDKLYFDGQEALSPYPAVAITTVGTTSLYADKEGTEREQYIFAGRQLKFLGFWSHNGKHGCFVEYNGKTGYVKEEEIVPFELPLHPNPLTFLPKQDEQPLPSNSAGGNEFTLKVLIIVCLAFAGILALFVATSKKTGRAQIAAGYYDENDYE